MGLDDDDFATRLDYCRDVNVARQQTQRKASAALSKIRFESFAEGTSVQILHVGSYDDEAPVLSRLHNEYFAEHNLTFNGKHHEIYLSDARRTEPAKLRTILRQPVTGL